LKIALAAVLEASHHIVNRLVPALSGDEHGELAGNLILVGDGDGAVLAVNPFFGELKRDHRIHAPDKGAKITLINYGTLISLKQALS
jgi:hypothetical protein